MICPHCSQENIEGVDECEQCQQPLNFLSRPVPSNDQEKRLIKDRLKLLKPREPVFVDAKTPVSEVLKMLLDHKIGCVLIGRDDDLQGIFTERDALMRLNTQAAKLADQPISEFMTPSPGTLEINDRIVFGLHKMDLGGYRHIPLLQDGKVAGIISVRDVLTYITQHLLAE